MLPLRGESRISSPIYTQNKPPNHFLTRFAYQKDLLGYFYVCKARTKWASPPQLPFPSILRGDAHFVRRCAAAFAAFLCTSCASRGAFYDIGNEVSYIIKKCAISRRRKSYNKFAKSRNSSLIFSSLSTNSFL